jgi:uncharacterized protein YukE
MRELARVSDLSAAQVSRIEGDAVGKPSSATLVKLAVALQRDSELLLIVAGQITGRQAGEILWRRAEAMPADETNVALKQLTALRNVEYSLRREANGRQSKLGRLQQEGAALRGQRWSGTGADELGAQVEEVDKQIQAASRELEDVRAELDDIEDGPTFRGLAATLFLAGSPQGTLATHAGPQDEPPAPALIIDEFAAEIARLGEIARLAAEIKRHQRDIHRTLEVVPVRLAELRRRLEIAFREVAAASDLGDPDFRDIRRRWSELEPHRKKNVLAFVVDQYELSIQEREVQRILSATSDDEAMESGEEFLAYFGEAASEEPVAPEIERSNTAEEAGRESSPPR